MKTKILYEDNDIIVCHKAAGLPVQSRQASVIDMESELKNYIRSKGSAKPYIGIVHRLDQPVEGVIVFAKNQKSAASLSSQVSGIGDKVMKKTYEALCYGHMPDSQGELVDYMYKDGKTNLSHIVCEADAKNADAKRAELDYEVLDVASSDNAILKDNESLLQLLRINLKTGRHHQIRLQLSNAGCPIIGDLKYGSDASIKFAKENGIRQLALKAVSLEFIHPITGKKVCFSIM